MQNTARQYQQLQPEERVTLASLAQQSYGVREMAQVLNRSPSTISRELRRNRGAQGYASVDAREQSAERRRANRPAIKLHADALLFDVVPATSE
jgi:IS30 family transposase